MIFIKRHWPLLLAVGILWVVVGVCLIISIRQNQGHFVYALDDAYIHVAMAKNFAQHGVWGITRYGFSSSSSSLLWTLLLSFIYFLGGMNEITPFVLNMIFSSLLIFWAYFVFRKYICNPMYIFIGLSTIIFFTPLPALIFTGQEHTLHVFLTVVFVFLSAGMLSSKKDDSSELRRLLILVPLITMTRYEGIFVVFIVGILFLARRKLLYGLALGGFGILPIVIYGLISISNGWYFLPNSVLLKGHLLDLSSFSSIINYFRFGYHQIVHRPEIWMLTLGTLFVVHFRLRKGIKLWQDLIIMIIVFLTTTCLHMQFAKTGFFYRYEAYLIALGIFILWISLYEYLPREIKIQIDKKFIVRDIALLFLILFTSVPFLVRGGFSVIQVPRATNNIYQQQYQMGLFLGKYYERQAIAINDIGAINYLADIECLDLVGLASFEVASAKLKKCYNREKISEITKSKHIKIAILYDIWFYTNRIGGLPSSWTKVGEWKISNNLVCADNVVSFYAVDLSEKENLIANLQHFSRYLPKNVSQSGTYVAKKRAANDNA